MSDEMYERASNFAREYYKLVLVMLAWSYGLVYVYDLNGLLSDFPAINIPQRFQKLFLFVAIILLFYAFIIHLIPLGQPLTDILTNNAATIPTQSLRIRAATNVFKRFLSKPRLSQLSMIISYSRASLKDSFRHGLGLIFIFIYILCFFTLIAAIGLVPEIVTDFPFEASNLRKALLAIIASSVGIVTFFIRFLDKRENITQANQIIQYFKLTSILTITGVINAIFAFLFWVPNTGSESGSQLVTNVEGLMLLSAIVPLVIVCLRILTVPLTGGLKRLRRKEAHIVSRQYALSKANLQAQHNLLRQCGFCIGSSISNSPDSIKFTAEMLNLPVGNYITDVNTKKANSLIKKQNLAETWNLHISPGNRIEEKEQVVVSLQPESTGLAIEGLKTQISDLFYTGVYSRQFGDGSQNTENHPLSEYIVDVESRCVKSIDDHSPVTYEYNLKKYFDLLGYLSRLNKSHLDGDENLDLPIMTITNSLRVVVAHLVEARSNENLLLEPLYSEMVQKSIEMTYIIKLDYGIDECPDILDKELKNIRETLANEVDESSPTSQNQLRN